MAPIQIAFAADEKFAPFLGTTIVSILDNSQENELFMFYILDGGITEKTKRRLEKLITSEKGRLVFLSLEKTEIKGLPNISYFSINTYSRLCLPDLLPECKKILYLDCDLLVRKSLDSLWNVDLKDRSLGVIPETSEQDQNLEDFKRFLGMSGPYFNAGVLLIDLERVRERKLFQKCLDFIRDNPDKLNFPDQNALNVVFDDDKVLLPRKWNANPTQLGFRVLYRLKRQKPEQTDEINEALYDPAIVHYVTSSKPWSFMYMGRFKREYWSALRKTPWANFRPTDVSILGAVKKPLIWLRDRVLYWGIVLGVCRRK